jgi:hypothetical protein
LQVAAWDGVQWAEQRLQTVRLARCQPPLVGRFDAYPPLGCLTGLRRLNLASNRLSGSIPALVTI